jgi:hypothetical protein
MLSNNAPFSKHFVLLKLCNKTFGPTQVSTQGFTNVDEFKEAIKDKFSPLLASYNAAQLTLFETDGATKINEQTEINEIYIEKVKPLIVKVEIPVGSPDSQKSRIKMYEKCYN